MKNWPVYYAIAVMIVVAVLLVHITQEQNACEMAGGTYVRGVWWYKCVHEGFANYGPVHFTAPVHE